MVGCGLWHRKTSSPEAILTEFCSPRCSNEKAFSCELMQKLALRVPSPLSFVHILMVYLAGFRKRMRAMITIRQEFHPCCMAHSPPVEWGPACQSHSAPRISGTGIHSYFE